MATKLGRGVNYHEEAPPMKNMTLYLYYQNPKDHKTWQNGD